MYQKMKASTIKEDNDNKIEMKKLKEQVKSHDEDRQEMNKKYEDLLKENEKLKFEAEYLKNRQQKELEDAGNQSIVIKELSEQLQHFQNQMEELKKGELIQKDLLMLIETQSKEIESYRQSLEDIKKREEGAANEQNIIILSSNLKCIYKFSPNVDNLLSWALLREKCPFVKAIKYPHPDNQVWRCLVSDNEFIHPPEDGWGSRTYFIHDPERPTSHPQLPSAGVVKSSASGHSSTSFQPNNLGMNSQQMTSWLTQPHPLALSLPLPPSAVPSGPLSVVPGGLGPPPVTPGGPALPAVPGLPVPGPLQSIPLPSMDFTTNYPTRALFGDPASQCQWLAFTPKSTTQ